MTPTPPPADLDRLAAQPMDDIDVRTLQLMAELHDTLDPVPPGLVDRIAFGITLDALHAEIASLQRDGDLVGARGEATHESQSITFTSAGMTMMITITAGVDQAVRVDGWVVPGGGVTIELRTADDTLSARSDSDGRFVFEAVPRGLAQFTMRPPAGQPVVTPSIQL